MREKNEQIDKDNSNGSSSNANISMIEVSGHGLRERLHKCQIANKPKANMKMICQNEMSSKNKKNEVCVCVCVA